MTVTAVLNPALVLGSATPSRISKPRRAASRRLALVPSKHLSTTIERQRVRKLVGAAEAARESPFEGLAPADGNGGVALSREVIASHLDGCEAVQLEAFEQALTLAAEAVRAASREQEGWVDGVRASLSALLQFFDEEPVLAQYLVVYSAQAGPAVLARRREVLDRVALLLDDERAPARACPPPLTAHAVASGVLGVLYARLSEPEPDVLVELVEPLMSFTVMPFVGARAARRELRRPVEAVSSSTAGVGVDLLQDPGKRLNHHREVEVLGVLADEPGLNNSQVGLRAGIKDQGYISRLLARLARLGLIETTPNPRRSGAKAWRLTTSGEHLQAAIRREACTTALVRTDLPEQFAGRLDFWAVCVLRAVAEQPWLTSSEVAARAGVDSVQISRLLTLLAGLGLVDAVREAHRKGCPKVWQITNQGRKLEEKIGRAAPRPARSVAIDLMWESGGRLSELTVAVLRVSAAEPGLSNSEIARRVGITDANRMSQVLSRLARRGLIENARNSGRKNVWALTAAGTTLEHAIRQEAATPASRTVAFDVLTDRGGRLNHLVASVLVAVGAEPGLSNTEIAERVGIESKGHASVLLTRLARFGLIENLVVDAAPFEANAWRLTISGRQLETTIRHEVKRRKLVTGRSNCELSAGSPIEEHPAWHLSHPIFTATTTIKEPR
jgi:DNA-binding MarR family transcriptional regulator